MFMRRKLLIRCFTASVPRGVQAPASEVSPSSAVASAALAGVLARPHGTRAFSMGPSYWDASTSARRELYSDLATARQFLPNRSNFITQFTPHGFQLIPENLPTAPAEAQQPGAEAAAAAGAAPAAAGAAAAQPYAGAVEPLFADSVKRKRRLAMKKHKYKKRMKKLRGAS